jgi:2-succinyl-6-hydroxy-2,4-cyclohexadiene-1-carboxylate synthase
MHKMQNELMNYRVFGNGHPVVFLHGFMESISMWQFIEENEFPFQCILIDLPGHGKSELWDANESPSLNFMAAEVQKLIQFLGIQNYHVVGHSMGGYVAMILKETDDNCQKVVLLNSTFKEDSDLKKRDRVRVADLALKAKNLFIQEAIPGLFYRFEKDDSCVQALIEEAKQMEGQAIAYAALAMRERTNTFHLLNDFPSDIFVVQGKHDPLISCEAMREDLMNHSNQLIVLEDVGHMSHFENPSGARKALRTILT